MRRAASCGKGKSVRAQTTCANRGGGGNGGCYIDIVGCRGKYQRGYRRKTLPHKKETRPNNRVRNRGWGLLRRIGVDVTENKKSAFTTTARHVTSALVLTTRAFRDVLPVDTIESIDVSPAQMEHVWVAGDAAARERACHAKRVGTAWVYAKRASRSSRREYVVLV